MPQTLIALGLVALSAAYLVHVWLPRAKRPRAKPASGSCGCGTSCPVAGCKT